METPQNPEVGRSKETLFPLDPDLIELRMRVFEGSSEDFLRLVTETRGKYGFATSLYANMPFADLLRWHEEKQDFQEHSGLYYRAGLLYGMDIAKATRLGRDPMAYKLDAGHPEAFAKALAYMEDTYRGLDDTHEFGAYRQLAREQRYTGSQVLAAAAAAQYGRLSEEIGALGLSDEEIVDHAVALQVGMVDGAIFVDAYSAFVSGHEPQMFEDA